MYLSWLYIKNTIAVDLDPFKFGNTHTGIYRWHLVFKTEITEIMYPSTLKIPEGIPKGPVPSLLLLHSWMSPAAAADWKLCIQCVSDVFLLVWWDWTSLIKPLEGTTDVQNTSQWHDCVTVLVLYTIIPFFKFMPWHWLDTDLCEMRLGKSSSGVGWPTACQRLLWATGGHACSYNQCFCTIAKGHSSA